MNFFANPEDLKGWVKVQPSPEEAAQKLTKLLGTEEQSLKDACEQIFKSDSFDMVPSQQLYEILAKSFTSLVKAGHSSEKLVKEAQIMRQPGQYNMPLRVCPKLPFSVGGRLISTYNCRHYCLDSIVLDDDPERVYCAEAIWRRHVMDKFSREFKDKNGKWVGGYLNERFQVFHDDGGNPMELAHGERTRKPRPHQYSTERRLEEARGVKTEFIEANSNKTIKLASINTKVSADEEIVTAMFRDVLEMKEDGISDEDIIYKVAEHYDKDILRVAEVFKFAMKQLTNHDGIRYAYSSPDTRMAKTAGLPLSLEKGRSYLTTQDVNVEVVNDVGDPKGVPTVLRQNTSIQVVQTNPDGTTIGQVADGGAELVRIATTETSKFESVDVVADEVGLNEPQTPVPESNTANVPNTASDENFPIVES